METESVLDRILFVSRLAIMFHYAVRSPASNQQPLCRGSIVGSDERLNRRRRSETETLPMTRAPSNEG